MCIHGLVQGFNGRREVGIHEHLLDVSGRCGAEIGDHDGVIGSAQTAVGEAYMLDALVVDWVHAACIGFHLHAATIALDRKINLFFVLLDAVQPHGSIVADFAHIVGQVADDLLHVGFLFIRQEVLNRVDLVLGNQGAQCTLQGIGIQSQDPFAALLAIVGQDETTFFQVIGPEVLIIMFPLPDGQDRHSLFSGQLNSSSASV